jgi:hypothetical protein
MAIRAAGALGRQDTAAALHRANLAFRVLSGGWRLRAVPAANPVCRAAGGAGAPSAAGTAA